MNILSDYTLDTRTVPHRSGGYEWWYFDAIATDGKYSFVIIFYEGNPFSLRYIRALEQGMEVMSSSYPAVSIVVYEDAEPIYYSFTEWDKKDCLFKEDQVFVKVGPHQMEGARTGHKLQYELRLNEQLPSGDRIEADLNFVSNIPEIHFGGEMQSGAHEWNLVQPRARVEGQITIGNKHKEHRSIDFNGLGYHDHNTGREPMRNTFEDWYWGRFHFNYATLIYYVMNQKDGQQYRAWLIKKVNNQVLETFSDIRLEDRSLSLFGLSPAHKLMFESENIKIQVQQLTKKDNGPFYQRFKSKALLNIEDKGIFEWQQGISEYICPDRINCRLFWPLVRMRIRQANEKPHWVQRSKRFYRWTW